MAGIVIRPAVADDQRLLWEFLAMAAYEPNADAVKAIPFAAAFLDGWQRPDDFGFVAERAGLAIGATWARQFASHEQWPFYIDDRTPEMSIGVNENDRGQGVGQLLVCALIDEATHRGLRLCLNVRDTNPARRLYERIGFRAVPGMIFPNRVGGRSIGMVLGALS